MKQLTLEVFEFEKENNDMGSERVKRKTEEIKSASKTRSIRSDRDAPRLLRTTPTKEELEKLYSMIGSKRKIAKILRCSAKFISNLMKIYGIKTRSHIIPFNPVPSDDLAYVIGVSLGDSSLRIRDRRKVRWEVSLKVRDKEFAEAFYKSVSRVIPSSKVRLQEKLKKGYNVYRVSLHSKKLVEFLLQFRENPQKADSYVLRKSQIIGLIKGFYDSEGYLCIRLERNSFQVRMSNTNKEVILYIKRLLEKIGLKPAIEEDRPRGKRKKTLYYITFHSKYESLKFLTTVGSNIYRKSLSLIVDLIDIGLLSLNPKRVDDRVLQTLKEKYNVDFSSLRCRRSTRNLDSLKFKFSDVKLQKLLKSLNIRNSKELRSYMKKFGYIVD